ncbi:PH domain-containing protein [Shewanella sp. NIFS-20-20]|uniref:PH domain-containing protein n=1 Tax=Shewanella sp. NIFS-20-20 TaxID=2853806 RepID=UPI001C48F21F|nr:PH domain-containing protein [Shewanella sp. NIFS-20-20]MBV7316489.1 PH domain-containing protein [Shewanella sp. NIFS-20-20]
MTNPESSKTPVMTRLSPWAIVSYIFARLKGFISNGYALIPLVYASWKVDFNSMWLTIGASSLMAILLLSALVYWLRFRYQLQRDKLVVVQGLLFTQKDEIPFDKILNVRIEQPFYFKPLDLFTLVAETAGSKQDEVQLRALSAAAAKHLQADLLSTQPQITPVQSPSEREISQPAPVWIHKNGDDLALFGLYQNNLLWLALILGPLLGQIDFDAIAQQAWFQVIWGQASQWTHGDLMLELLLGLTLLMAGFLLLSLLSVISAILKYYPYHLRFDGRTITRTGGVISHQQDALAANRIQLLQLEQPWIARIFGRWTLRMKQVQGQEIEQHKQGNMLIPSIRNHELSTILTSINPGRFATSALHQLLPPKRYWSVHWIWLLKRSWLPLLPVCFSLITHLLWLKIGLVVLALISALLLVLYYCQLGYRINRGGIWLHTGTLGHQWCYIQYRKLQTVSLHSSPGLRRRRLCHVTLGLASGTIRIPCIAVAHAEHIYRQAMMATANDFTNWI